MNDKDIALCVQILVVLLHDDPNLVQPEVEGGIVYLQGVAANEQQKHNLENAIRYIRGVRGVVNCLALEHVARLPTSLALLPVAAPAEPQLAAVPRSGSGPVPRGRGHHSFPRPFGRRGLRVSAGVSR
jgi:hypothetical protein